MVENNENKALETQGIKEKKPSKKKVAPPDTATVAEATPGQGV